MWPSHLFSPLVSHLSRWETINHQPSSTIIMVSINYPIIDGTFLVILPGDAGATGATGGHGGDGPGGGSGGHLGFRTWSKNGRKM